MRELKVARGTIGFFAARIDGNLVFYTASDFIKTEKTEFYDKELTPRLAPISPNTVAAAFASESKIIACFGNTAGEKEAAPFQTNHLLDANADYQVRLYQSETGRWVDLGRHHGKRLLSLTVDIEPYGFALFTFEA
ncbi:MAG TPA: hypothetical protein VHR86_08725 [Armatimonadota bacterium]|nr:hypothetical protein [Armatimonadota bacterium]